jgi:ZIP family zinc transporter
MAGAFGWGALAASSLVIGAVVALLFHMSLRAIGWIISNLPEAISSTTGLATSGWKKSRILWMWIAIAVISGIASLAGYGLFQNSSPDVVAFVLAFAAGAILTMLADTMMPEAYEHGGKLVGVLTTLGFAVAYAIHTLT